MSDENARLALENEELQAQVAFERGGASTSRRPWRESPHSGGSLRKTSRLKLRNLRKSTSPRTATRTASLAMGSSSRNFTLAVNPPWVSKGNVKTNRDHIEQENTVDGFGGRRKFVGIRI
ncbi:hypothetical protein IWW34DRAFT_845850 [Fusarium oxysporum f. sp. albedinis]|nr:hypothetical protein IWW34DRAFT_845850 [Fusarium oxysporum f. sp. albedinis]KAJ0147707.1 FAD-binding monooxygenase BOA2 [Fusarium oxysporum f. sp. albedinis]KAK2484386.1 hypothetical protein H9L39_02366 [Fusarium oxysporum f. sp. albedinis]